MQGNPLRSAEERWRLAGGRTVEVDGQYATRQEKEGKKRVQREREAASIGKRRGTIGVWSGGREKRNEQYIKQ